MCQNGLLKACGLHGHVQKVRFGRFLGMHPFLSRGCRRKPSSCLGLRDWRGPCQETCGWVGAGIRSNASQCSTALPASTSVHIETPRVSAYSRMSVCKVENVILPCSEVLGGRLRFSSRRGINKEAGHDAADGIGGWSSRLKEIAHASWASSEDVTKRFVLARHELV